MKREDLVRISQQRQRFQIRTVVIGLPILFGSVALFETGTLDRVHPTWLAFTLFPGLAIAAITVVLANALHSTLEMPRCPHCKRWLMASLLHIAVVSGRCGYCGRSIEDRAFRPKDTSATKVQRRLTPPDPHAAPLVRSLLESSGIPFVILGEQLHGLLPGFGALRDPEGGSLRLQVPPEYEKQVRSLLADFL